MRLYLRTGFGLSKISYSRKIFFPFQVLFHENGGEPERWFLVSYIMILYLKEKGNGVEIKTEITRAGFRLFTIMFVNGVSLTILGKIIYSKWDEVLQQHQITVDFWS